MIPIIAVDFSVSNITLDLCNNLHSSNPLNKNDYRDLLQMLAKSYENILNLPIFGYSAKTAKNNSKVANFFPISRNIRNPFTSNHPEALLETYNECSHVLE